MSKSALKKYLSELKKKDLEDQVIDLYERFAHVKTYYDFVFNPKEEKLLGEAKAKIANEYFPLKRKRPRARRSVAHKYIRQYNTLGMDPMLLADLMLYNLETAQQFSSSHRVNEAFYKSMLRSFKEAVQHISFNALQSEFKVRVEKIHSTVGQQQWEYGEDFDRIFHMHFLENH